MNAIEAWAIAGGVAWGISLIYFGTLSCRLDVDKNRLAKQLEAQNVSPQINVVQTEQSQV